jgi:hypothetical protein
LPVLVVARTPFALKGLTLSYSNIPHLRANGASEAAILTPAKTNGAGSGTSPTITVAGADERGTVNIVTGGSPAAGTLVTLTFATPYTIAPDAVLVSANDTATAAVGGLYASASKTALTIGTHGTPAGTMKINYLVVGGV